MNIEIDCANDSYYDSVTPSDRESQEKESTLICRICMESDEQELISPCRCSGSVKYVHEECLKAWILSQDEDIEEAKCELCKTPLKTEITISTKVTCAKACEQSVAHCIFAPLLLTVLSMLILIIYLLAERFADSETSRGDRGYTLGLMVACSLAAIVILVLAIQSVREACVRSKVQTWKILSQDLEEVNKEEIEDGPADQTMVNQLSESSVINLPKKVKYRGRRLIRPTIAPPSLTPINQNGRLIGFRTRNDSWNSTLLRAELSQSQADRYRVYDQVGVTPILGRSTIIPFNQ